MSSGSRRPWVWIAGLAALSILAAGTWSVRRALWNRAGDVHAVPLPDLAGAEGPVARSLTLLRAAVVSRPGSAEAWGRYAMGLDVHGFDRLAVAAYRRATELRPDEFRWAYDLAIVLSDLGEAEALDWFRKSRDLREDYAPLYVRYGRALYDAGEFAGAAVAFDRALALDSTLAPAHLGRARVALAGNDLETSEAHLRKGIARAAGDAALHGTLAEVLRRSGDTVQAAREAWRARVANRPAAMPDPVRDELLTVAVGSRSFIDRGLRYLDAGRPDLAERAFRDALVGRPGSPEAHDGLGTALQRLGRYGEAEAEHRRALMLRPDYREAMANLSVSLFAQGNVVEAVARADSAIRMDSTFAQAYLILGGYLSYAGRQAEALATYRIGLAKAPFDPRIAIRLAWLRATARARSLRDGAEAVRLAEAVCALDDYSVPEEVDVLAAAYAETGAYARAASFAGRARDLAIAQGKAELARAIESRESTYRSGRPYRE